MDMQNHGVELVLQKNQSSCGDLAVIEAFNQESNLCELCKKPKAVNKRQGSFVVLRLALLYGFLEGAFRNH